MEIEMVAWSDNDNIEEIANILHDEGYRTAEIRKESLGSYEDKCNWSWCKLNMIDSFCVDLNNAMGKTVDIDDVDEMPMYRYVVYIIVGDDDDTEDTAKEENKGEETMEEKKVNATMNIGCTTKNGVEFNPDSMINKIGKETDCTITRCVGFYKGHRENSLKVEIYDTRADIAVSMASYFAHIFMQECIAVTVGDSTVFVNDDYTDTEFVEWCDALEK